MPTPPTPQARPLRFRIWDNERNGWYEPTYRAYKGELEELLLSPSGDLIMRTMKGITHESMFPGRFFIQRPTGLTDKYGNEIFEGDIVHVRDRSNDQKGWNEVWTVEYDDTAARFIVFNQLNSCRDFDHDHASPESPIVFITEDLTFKPEILGNIYEHPHLLE